MRIRITALLYLLFLAATVTATAQIHVKSALDRPNARVPLATPGQDLRLDLPIGVTQSIQASIDPNAPTTRSVTLSTGAVVQDTDPTDCKTPDAQGQLQDLKFRRWKPASQTREHARCYWAQGGREFVKATNLSGTGGTVANTTEIVSDLAGPTRVAFSTAVAGSTDDDEEDTSTNASERNLTLLRTNGGNVAVGGVYPVFLDRWGPATIAVHGFGRTAFNISALGGSNPGGGDSVDWSELNGNAEASVEMRALMNSDTDVFKVVLYARPGIVGGTKAFRESLGEKGRNVLVGGEVGAIARIGTYFTVGLSWTAYQADLPGTGGAFHFAFGQ